MSDHSIQEIERSLERDRVALAQSVAALRERVRPRNLMLEGKSALMAQASPLVSQVDRAVRGHPVAATVAGLALAALVLGRRASVSDVEAATEAPALAGTRFEALTRWEDEGGPPAPEPVDPEEDWLTEARGLRAKAQGLLRQIDDAARRGLAPAALLARHRAEVVAALAAETRIALGKGLGSMSEAARATAIEARERVYLSRIAVAEKGRATVEARPLAVGAAVAAAGALVACLFPQTETEDRLLGEARDRLAEDLKRTVKHEVTQASDLARSLSSAFKSDLGRAAALFTPSPGADRPQRPH
ncbi:DUF3618 domain-containing protein [Rhodobacter sp. SY28-1]|uniref:DUF3618 domain-containing protein n=1 Tax=Rhodobacter sp. SY28-1 TaxID=2562317 RepID=UPI0010BFDB07|nr:DUF3618 domain-containing protein [Rhodobacter sp. SY28-1]